MGGDLGGLFYPLGTGSLGQDGRHGCVDRCGCWDCFGGDCGCGVSMFFCLFWRGCLGDMMGVRVVIEVVVGAIVLVGVVSLRMVVGIDGAGNRGGVRWVVEEMLVWLMVEKLGGGIVAGSPMGFSENSGKTSDIVSHSRSTSVMSFCRLTCKE